MLNHSLEKIAETRISESITVVSMRWEALKKVKNYSPLLSHGLSDELWLSIIKSVKEQTLLGCACD